MTRELVCSDLSLAPNDRVVTMLHIVVLITTGDRTEKPVMSLLKKPSRMARLLSRDHWEVVVKAQGADIEQHVQLRCGHC